MGRVDKCWVWVRLGSGFEIFLGFRLGFEIFLWVWVGMTGSGLGLFIITFFPKIDPPYPFYCNFLGSVLVGSVIFFQVWVGFSGTSPITKMVVHLELSIFFY